VLIKTSNIALNVEELNFSPAAKETLIFLHGFTGSSTDWKNISSNINGEYKIFAVDLIGHGKSYSPEDVRFYSTSFQTKQLAELFSKITTGKIILAGYSMGGRAALSFAAAYSQMIKGLILESASAGILEKKLREDRIKSDEKLANFILNNTIENFVDYWMNLDIFSTQKKLPEKILFNIKMDKLKNNKRGLVNSLRGFGTGIMPPLFDSLKNIKIKTLLISGELDPKYTNINGEMVKIFPDAMQNVIADAGHNAHLEKPEAFYNVINNYLKEL
jgi:2-succinyl-6-hydroxy-2,4-cyclohexadiene-1-carboxylate synthase